MSALEIASSVFHVAWPFATMFAVLHVMNKFVNRRLQRICMEQMEAELAAIARADVEREMGR